MLKDCPLGQTTVYIETYAPDLLYPVPRTLARDKTGIVKLPFSGVDIWNAFEISWLNTKGKPEIALAELFFPCESPNIVESKSLKLYFNSFNQTKFESFEQVQQIIENDLKKIIEKDVAVLLYSHAFFETMPLGVFSGICLDDMDVEIDTYKVNPDFLTSTAEKHEETLYTNLFKSNCLATGQPDWGSVLIRYSGNKIDREGLLKYLISFRSHSGFAEHCVEQIFHDLMNKCSPEKLTVYARYTRRGGLDINPFRSNFEEPMSNIRHVRQ